MTTPKLPLVCSSIPVRPLQHMGTAGLLAALLLASPLSSAQTAVKENFNNKPTVTAERASEGAQAAASIAPAPDDAGNSVLKIEWAAHKGSHIGANLSGKGTLLISEPGTYKVTARVNLEQTDDNTRRLALRLMDSQGEIFQFRADILDADKFGWQEISWTIDTDLKDMTGVSSWGGTNPNKQIDLPLYLKGFAVDFKDWSTKGGCLYIDDISVAPAAN